MKDLIFSTLLAGTYYSINFYIASFPRAPSFPHISIFYHFPVTSFRGRFEGMCSSLFRMCVEPLHKVLEKSVLAKDDIQHVCACLCVSMFVHPL